MRNQERACLITVNWEAEECMWTFFDEENAVEKCWNLKANLEGDWPGCSWTVVGNEAAKKRWGNRLVEKLRHGSM